MRRATGRNFLFVPGPTNVPDRVQRAMIVAMEDHRSSRFPDLSMSVLSDLKKVFKTDEGQVFIFPSSGTGAGEAAGADLENVADAEKHGTLSVPPRRAHRHYGTIFRPCGSPATGNAARPGPV